MRVFQVEFLLTLILGASSQQWYRMKKEGMETSQCSTIANHSSKMAIDINFSTWSACTTTNLDIPGWWQVKFGFEAAVAGVKIFTPHDKIYANQLQNIIGSVTTSDTLEPKEREHCFKDKNENPIFPDELLHYKCDRGVVVGSYFLLMRSRQSKHSKNSIAIGEIALFTNRAKMGTVANVEKVLTTQCGSEKSWAQYAIDGIDSTFSECQNVNKHDPAWWQVDFLSSRSIVEVDLVCPILKNKFKHLQNIRGIMAEKTHRIASEGKICFESTIESFKLWPGRLLKFLCLKTPTRGRFFRLTRFSNSKLEEINVLTINELIFKELIYDGGQTFEDDASDECRNCSRDHITTRPCTFFKSTRSLCFNCRGQMVSYYKCDKKSQPRMDRDSGPSALSVMREDAQEMTVRIPNANIMATQSENWLKTTARYALDGLLSTSAISVPDSDVAWWQAYLDAFYKVAFVTIHSVDGQHVTSNFNIYVANESLRADRPTPKRNLCKKHYGYVERNKPLSFECEKPVPSRYVQVVKQKSARGTKYLSLGEVEIYIFGVCKPGVFLQGTHIMDLYC